jgi:hypothetical protein
MGEIATFLALLFRMSTLNPPIERIGKTLVMGFAGEMMILCADRTLLSASAVARARLAPT